MWPVEQARCGSVSSECDLSSRPAVAQLRHMHWGCVTRWLRTILSPCRGPWQPASVLLPPYEESWRSICSRRFSVQRCARCHLGISASEMVMRARDSVYHLSCFTCTTCNKTLTTGDHFGMKDSLVYCRLHFETLVQGPDYHPQLNFAELAAKGGGLSLPYFNGTGTAQKGRPRKRKSPAMGIDIPSYSTGESGGALTHSHTHTHTHTHTHVWEIICAEKG